MLQIFSTSASVQTCISNFFLLQFLVHGILFLKSIVKKPQLFDRCRKKTDKEKHSFGRCRKKYDKEKQSLGRCRKSMIKKDIALAAVAKL